MTNIIAFPVWAWESHVRETVDILMKRHGVAADRFWRTTVNRLRGQLQVGGLDEHQVEEQLRHFASAVIARVEATGVEDFGGDAA